MIGNKGALGLVLLVSVAAMSCHRSPCPHGTELSGAAPPHGVEQWCQKRDRTGNYVKHGSTTLWYESGEKKAEGQFRDDRAHGRWTWWRTDGQKVEQGEVRNGLKEGTWIFWYPNGVKAAVLEFHDDRRHGQGFVWYDDGKKQIEGSFRNGKRHGTWKEFSRDGQMTTVEYRDGKKESEGP